MRWVLLCVLLSALASCGSPPMQTDAAPDGAGGGTIDAGADAGHDAASPRPLECDDLYDAFSSQSLWIREARSGPLLFSEVLSRSSGTWHGLFVDGSRISEGDIVDLQDESALDCAVCYFLGTECTDPADWRTCATMRMATRGRVWIGRFPGAPGDDAVVEMSDVFLDPITIDRDTLRTTPAAGGCVYQRQVSYTSGAVRDGELSCTYELHCPFAER